MSKKKTKDEPPATFEAALEKLQRIVQELEQGELGLSESLQKYEEGIQCLKYCYGQLESAQQRIELLTGMDAEGQAQTEPFDETTMSLEEKADTRGQRRSRGTRRGPRRPRPPESTESDPQGPALF
jgi:exodeoxyribonuclease VII small subunit